MASVAAPASGLSVAASPADPAAAAQPLKLVSQTSWVTAAHPTFDLVVEAGPGTPTISHLGLNIAVYPCLGTPSGFDETLTKSGPSGRALDTTSNPVAWSSLAPAFGGGVDVPVPVTANGTSSGSSSAGAPLGGFVASLRDCNVANGGVYPVRLQLVDTRTGGVIGSLTTHLVYSTAPADTKKLRFAWELPIQTPVGSTSTSPPSSVLAADPLKALARPSAGALDNLAGVVDAVAGAPGVPVTLAPSSQTLQALQSFGHASSVKALTTAANLADRQFLWTSYVPVDATALVDTGLTGELTLQLQAGWSTTAQELQLDSKRPAPAPGVPGTAGAWVTNDTVDDATLGQLQSQGYDQLVLPSSDLTSTPSPSSSGSTAAPFTLTAPNGAPFTALATNSDLSSRFTADPGDPVLAAHQLLAELAQVYFEGGNTQSVRGVVAVPPNNWVADPTFVRTLLAGLAQNPVVQAVTVSGLFQSLPGPVACRTQGCKLSASAKTAGAGLPVTAISTQRTRLTNFGAAAPSAQQVRFQISELLLAGQSEILRPGQQAQVVQRSGTAIGAQLGQLSVAGDKSFTLTARNGNIPVTIASNAAYPVKGTLTLTSDKLTFSGGATHHSLSVSLGKSTNNYYVPVQARASGEFKVGITLTSPSGGLVLTRGAVTVRSTATSVVGIALSL
ncbi:MAG: hypothetical protein QOJ44_2029, partial [Acidimicrobiaceae bacterium]|nr:hypothetical protein [Acidimicrobiaceae bacterium]